MLIGASREASRLRGLCNYFVRLELMLANQCVHQDSPSAINILPFYLRFMSLILKYCLTQRHLDVEQIFRFLIYVKNHLLDGDSDSNSAGGDSDASSTGFGLTGSS